MKQDSRIIEIEEYLATTLRTLAADDLVQIEFSDEIKNNFFSWNQNLIFDKKNVVLPVLDKSPRASVDMAACYLMLHNSAIHAAKNFDEQEQKTFDEFEKIRLISEVKNSYLGIFKNILDKIEDDIYRGSTSLSLVLLKEIFGEELPEITFEVSSELEHNLSSKIIAEIKNLAKKTNDQEAFAQGVYKVLELLRREREELEKDQNEEKSKEKSEENSQNSKDDLSSFGQENIVADAQESFSKDDQEDGEQVIEMEQQISELKDDDKEGDIQVKLDSKGSDKSKIEFKNPYKVYTTKFDEVVFPQKMVSKKDLELLRDQLDLKMVKLNSISKKMTLKLKRKLLSKRNTFLEFDASRGVLNRKKLTRLVVDPLTENIWVNSKSHEYQDTALTILLDNSGSMRGNPIVMSAMACEIIAGILEKFSIKTEIIGFTTADWKGGKVRKLWESAGREKNPGRLNELRHIIYKHFNERFKKSKINLGLMLKEGLLKENIDGEALLFARSRLAQQSERRKILLVISDGTPVDDSTNSTNDRDILTDHLHHVINKIENSSRNKSQIEIVGIGIGHSTEEFYRNSITIKSLEELGDVMIEKIVDLL